MISYKNIRLTQTEKKILVPTQVLLEEILILDWNFCNNVTLVWGKNIFLFGENFNTWIHKKYYNIYRNVGVCYVLKFSPIKLIIHLSLVVLSYNK